MAPSSSKAHSADKIATIFPPPSFLNIGNCAFDISEGRIRYLGFRQGMRGITLSHYGSEDIASLAKESGEKVKSALKEKLTSIREHIGSPYIKLMLPESEVYLFRTTVLKSAAANIRGAIEFKLEENVPIPPQDAVFQYDVESISPVTGDISVCVSVVSREYVSDLISLFGACGYTVFGCDTQARALSRALKAENDETELIVSVNEETTTAVIARKGMPLFSSTVPVGSKDMTDAIAKAMNISREKALALKKEHESSEADDVEFLGALVGVLSSLKDEVNKIVSFWNSRVEKGGGGEVKRAVFVGKDVHLAGVLKYLSSSIKAPVELGNVWKNAFSFDSHVPDITMSESLEYASVIGTALNS